MIKKCFGGVTVATRRVKEGERSVAYRFFINLCLKSQVPSPIPTNSDIMALFEEQKPTGVYVTSKSKQCISFSVKTEFSVNGVATTKDLTVYKDGMLDIHCLGKRLNVTEFGLQLPIRQNPQSVWSNVIDIRPCIGYQCEKGILGREMWTVGPDKAPEGRRRSRNCVGFVHSSQRADSCCVKCIASRPHVTASASAPSCHQTPPSTYNHLTKSLVYYFEKNAGQKSTQKRWNSE